MCIAQQWARIDVTLLTRAVTHGFRQGCSFLNTLPCNAIQFALQRFDDVEEVAQAVVG